MASKLAYQLLASWQVWSHNRRVYFQQLLHLKQIYYLQDCEGLAV